MRNPSSKRRALNSIVSISARITAIANLEEEPSLSQKQEAIKDEPQYSRHQGFLFRLGGFEEEQNEKMRQQPEQKTKAFFETEEWKREFQEFEQIERMIVPLLTSQ